MDILNTYPFDPEKRGNRADWMDDKRMVEVNPEGYDDFVAGHWAKLTLDIEPNHPAKELFEQTILESEVATAQHKQFRIDAVRSMSSIYN